MKCPSCGLSDSRVLDSRPTEEGNSIRRRRECAGCGKRFTTYEVIETTPITVIKKDGSREYFNRTKLEAGIMHACQKRPVDVGALVNTIERELQNAMITEIATEKIGEIVMEHLRALDAVSYVRFASVYREFKDADTFLEEINKVIRGGKKEKKGKC